MILFKINYLILILYINISCISKVNKNIDSNDIPKLRKAISLNKFTSFFYDPNNETYDYYYLSKNGKASYRAIEKKICK